MKVYHYALIFLIFFLAVILKTDISIGKLKSIENQKVELTANLNSATTDAVEFIATTGAYGGSSINKDELIKTFFTSFYSSLGIISSNSKQAEIELYIPVFLLCDYDGYYVYYYDTYIAEDGLTYSQRLWSEKMPYFYEDNYFIYRFTLSDKVYIYDKNNLLNQPKKLLELDYKEFQQNSEYESFRTIYSDCILLDNENFSLVKKGAIINQLEKILSYYTSKHNDIARLNGITYRFSFPAGANDEWAGYLDDVNLLVVFQGYPYKADGDYTFNKVASAGGNIIKKPVYYVEKKSWFYLAHIKGCSELESSVSVLEETFDSIDSCTQIGAYCDYCIEYGTRVPTLK